MMLLQRVAQRVTRAHNVAMATKQHMTPAARMAATRARREAAGIKEVRGIHAHVDDHAAVKDEANKFAERLTKRRAAAAKKQAKGESK